MLSQKPDFGKYADGLVPCVVQENNTSAVLMVGFMNEAALDETIRSGRVTFYSRSKQRLWTKGESSGNFLQLKSIFSDCDNDTLLCKVLPSGAVCHTGAKSCFGESEARSNFLIELEAIIQERRANSGENSYVHALFKKGINKIAQKVGEEAVELLIEAKDQNDESFKNEAADLLFHYLILLNAKGTTLGDISKLLEERHTKAIE